MVIVRSVLPQSWKVQQIEVSEHPWGRAKETESESQPKSAALTTTKAGQSKAKGANMKLWMKTDSTSLARFSLVLDLESWTSSPSSRALNYLLRLENYLKFRRISLESGGLREMVAVIGGAFVQGGSYLSQQSVWMIISSNCVQVSVGRWWRCQVVIHVLWSESYLLSPPNKWQWYATEVGGMETSLREQHLSVAD